MERTREKGQSVGKITVPDGKELKSFKLYCSKHGDITDAAIAMPVVYTDIKGEKHNDKNIYCIACLNEFLMKLQKDGYFGKIAVVPIVGDKEKESSSK